MTTVDSGKKWYILNVVSGQEAKIASEVKTIFFSNLQDNSPSQAIVPSRQVIKVKKGKKVQEAQKMFPGYIFVQMDMADRVTLNRILLIPKVLGFLGPKNNPEPVNSAKIDEILKTCESEPLNDTSASVKTGDSVTVIDGPFESFSGVVEGFDQEKQKVKISILIFGRATSVELELNQIKKN